MSNGEVSGPGPLVSAAACNHNHPSPGECCPPGKRVYVETVIVLPLHTRAFVHPPRGGHTGVKGGGVRATQPTARLSGQGEGAATAGRDILTRADQLPPVATSITSLCVTLNASEHLFRCRLRSEREHQESKPWEAF